MVCLTCPAPADLADSGVPSSAPLAVRMRPATPRRRGWAGLLHAVAPAGRGLGCCLEHPVPAARHLEGDAAVPHVRDDEFISQNFEFEGAPDMVNIEHIWCEDLSGGHSRLRGRSICPNIEARDALLSSGLEGSMTEATSV